jgi:hypothetical protein
MCFIFLLGFAVNVGGRIILATLHLISRFFLYITKVLFDDVYDVTAATITGVVATRPWFGN